LLGSVSANACPLNTCGEQAVLGTVSPLYSSRGFAPIPSAGDGHRVDIHQP
jgi:hypothetical protein